MIIELVKKNSSFFDKTIVYIFKAFPSHVYSNFVYKIARIEKPIWFKNLLLRILVYIYKIDLSSAKQEEFKKYSNFSRLFIRQLKDNLRIINSHPDAIISPVDGTISQIGLIGDNSIIQAKSKNYSLKKLLKNTQLAKYYKDGSFVTIYLAPHNYHRVHFPQDSQVESMSYVPGSLLSVNQFSAKKVNNLFVNQERAIINLKIQVSDKFQAKSQTTIPLGMSLVMVGALGVGSINTTWHGELTPPYGNKKSFHYPYGKIMCFKKADELGFFNLGSTVILIYPKNTIKLEGALKEGSKVKMGQIIAKLHTGDKPAKSKYEQSKEKKLKRY